jgi:hypothetical protein
MPVMIGSEAGLLRADREPGEAHRREPRAWIRSQRILVPEGAAYRVVPDWEKGSSQTGIMPTPGGFE